MPADDAGNEDVAAMMAARIEFLIFENIAAVPFYVLG
jgi:hypothetical protein